MSCYIALCCSATQYTMLKININTNKFYFIQETACFCLKQFLETNNVRMYQQLSNTLQSVHGSPM